MRCAALPLVILVLLCSCTKDDDGDAGSAGGDPCGGITGYSMVDVNGAAIQAPDTTDWRTTGAWCPYVEDLFVNLPPVSWVDTPLAEPAIAGFPNPCDGIFMMWLGNDTTGHVDLRIVDDQWNLVRAVDSITAHAITFRPDSLGLSDGHLFRIYYRIVHADGTAHRGHGDMLKE